MTAITFLVYPDQRENEESIQVLNRRLRPLRDGKANVPPLVKYGHIIGWPAFYGTKTDAVDAADLLGAVAHVQWAYPVLVVYRPANENRWSHSLMGLGYGTVVPS